MTDEKTLIRDNVKKIRRLLKEATGSDMADAIDNKDIIYIYYAGDDTIRRGFRTIEPHVLGQIKRNDGQGDLAVRAWEQAGASDTFKNPVGRWAKIPPRVGHEVFNDPNPQPGWRLFKLKGITYMLPTGKKFPKEGKPMRPMYKGASDQGFSSILTYAKEPSDVGSQEVDGSGSVRPDDVKQKLSAFDTQSPKWKINASDEEGELIKNVVALFKKVKEFNKDAPKYYDVAKKDGRYNAVRTNSRKRYQYADNEIVGNLLDLYNKYSESDFEDVNFFANQINRGRIADKKKE